MATALVFSVRAEGYGLLTIESLQLPNNAQNLLPPPLRQPVIDPLQAPDAIQPGGGPITIEGREVHSQPWNRWYLDLWRFLTNGGGALQIFAPSADETDIAWYGTGTVDAVTDPVSFTATLVNDPRAGTGALDARGLLLTITDPGSGYGAPPTFQVTGVGNAGQPGKGNTTISGAGKVTTMTLTHNGYGLVAPLVVTFSTGNAKATAVLGRQWAVGDYILWNDNTIVNRARSFEIDQISKIVPIDDSHATFTLARRAAGAPAGQAQYGSLMNAHAGQAFYRLINKCFTVLINPLAGPQLLKLPWDNMLVAAAVLAAPGLPPVTINLAPLPYVPGTTTLEPRAYPPCPGLRTMNGAEYINLKMTGALTLGQTCDNRVSVTSAWESIRCISGTLRTAASATTLIVDVMYISPDLTQVGLIDEFNILAGAKQSYDPIMNGLDGRQMPFHATWPSQNVGATDWPPELLPRLSGALDGSGNLQNGWSLAGGNVLWQPGGYIDAIVRQAGGTAADLMIANQT